MASPPKSTNEWRNESPTIKGDDTDDGQSEASEPATDALSSNGHGSCDCCITGRHETIPCAESTYLIKHRASGRFLVIKAGKLSLQSSIDGQVGSHWTCVEEYGWLGFQNVVSGRYLSYRPNSRQTFSTAGDFSSDGQYFVAKPHTSGGFGLYALWRDKLKKMELKATVSSGDINAESETTWSFVTVN